LKRTPRAKATNAPIAKINGGARIVNELMLNRGRELVVNRLFVVLTLGVVAVLVPWTQRSASASPHSEQAKKLASLATNWQTSGYIEIVLSSYGVVIASETVQRKLGGSAMLVKAMHSSRPSGGRDSVAPNPVAIVSCDKEVNVFHWHLTMPPEQASTRSVRRQEF
jgi:hypothetical protein